MPNKTETLSEVIDEEDQNFPPPSGAPRRIVLLDDQLEIITQSPSPLACVSLSESPASDATETEPILLHGPEDVDVGTPRLVVSCEDPRSTHHSPDSESVLADRLGDVGVDRAIDVPSAVVATIEPITEAGIGVAVNDEQAKPRRRRTNGVSLEDIGTRERPKLRNQASVTYAGDTGISSELKSFERSSVSVCVCMLCLLRTIDYRYENGRFLVSPSCVDSFKSRFAFQQ